MNSKQQISLTLVLLLVAACGSNSSGGNKVTEPLPFPDAPQSGVQGDGRLGELVQWAVDAQEIPAMAVVVVHRGQVVDIAAEGMRASDSSEPVTTGDAWHIGSLTKAMTGSLVGVMVEMGVVSWDTTPLDVWPELDGSIHRNLREITIRHLLSHTAGIERVNTAPSRYADDATGTLVEKRRAFAAELLGNSPVVQVGTYSYSNGGYIIVGAMLETMMSASWESLLTDYVLAPLAMNDTGFGAPGQPGGLSQPWGHWEHNDHFDPVSPGPDADNPQVFGPAGTVHTTLGDYARFMIAHIDGFNGFGSFISANTFHELHTPVVDETGLGWGVGESADFPGRVLLAHGGSNLRWYAIVTLVPELDGGAFYVVNAGGNRAQAAIDRVEDFVVDRYKAMQ
jgi:CubicO group peptidase (beta-lactamase class C family)